MGPLAKSSSAEAVVLIALCRYITSISISNGNETQHHAPNVREEADTSDRRLLGIAFLGGELTNEVLR